VEEFVPTADGPVPRVRTSLDRVSLWGTVGARCGLRTNYKVVPGLYCVGSPGPDSPALLTANYKLSFDHLRTRLGGVDAWLVVLDTHGVNVWCAASKGLFSTGEAAARVRSCGLDTVAPKATLILPQLGATGVDARELAKRTGRGVRFGPIRAQDVKPYLDNGTQAEEVMRGVTFTLAERTVLTPVELFLLAKPLLFVFLGLFALSGIGPDVYSLNAAWQRGLAGADATLLAVLAGAVVGPILLPWLPGRTFSLKGAQTGILAGLAAAFTLSAGLLSALALLLWCTALSSYLCMNFTGSTPFTSPSGVEKEMRRFIPMQLAAVVLALVFWVAAGFVET
jgi:hypothetical protein